jgi:hypothetical protein
MRHSHRLYAPPLAHIPREHRPEPCEVVHVRRDPAQEVGIPEPLDDSHYYVNIHINPSKYYGQCCELARCAVGDREVGVIRGIWQWARSDAPDYWHPDPAALKRVGINMVWHLRLIQGPLDLKRWQGLPQNLPGRGFPGLSQWPDIRYPWGYDPLIKLIVPANHTVMIIAQFPEDDATSSGDIGTNALGHLHEIGGRLWGNKASAGAQFLRENLERLT